MKATLNNPGMELAIKGWPWLGFFKGLCATLGISFDKSKEVADVIIKHYKVGVGNKSLVFFDGAVAADVQNFGGNVGARRNAGEPILLGAIRALAGANAAVNATDWSPGFTSAELQNGTFNLVADGTVILRDIPMSVFNGDGTESSELGFFKLSRARPIKDQSTIQLQASWDVALALATLNVGFELHCVGQIS